jgi:hypothetical protein
VTAASEDEASHAPVNGSEKSELALFEGYEHVAAPKFDAVRENDLISGGGIKTQGVQRVIEFVRRLIC